MNVKGPHTQGLLKHATKAWRNDALNLSLPDFSIATNATLIFIWSPPEEKQFFALLPVAAYPTARHYTHQAFPSQIRKNSLVHFDLSYFMILSFSVTSQVLHPSSSEQIILWKLSFFALYSPFSFSWVCCFSPLMEFKIQLSWHNAEHHCPGICCSLKYSLHSINIFSCSQLSWHFLFHHVNKIYDDQRSISIVINKTWKAFPSTTLKCRRNKLFTSSRNSKFYSNFIWKKNYSLTCHT